MRTFLHSSIVSPSSFLAVFSLVLFFHLSACKDKDRDDNSYQGRVTPALVEVNADATLATEHSAVLDNPVTLDFHFLAPLDVSLSNPQIIDPYANPDAVPFSNLSVETTVATDYPGLRHIRIRATGNLPTLDSFGDLKPSIQTAGFVMLRYAISVSDGTAEGVLYGDFPAFIDRSTAESQANVTDTAITLPAADGAVTAAEIDIEGTFSNPRAENYRTHWYVSGGGALLDQHEAKTKLTLPGPGTYTLVFTVKAQYSKASAIRFRTLTL